MQRQVASRHKVKIKMAISSPTGFGKTYSSLLLAYGITGDWSKITVIDSENDSAQLYSDLGKYNIISIPPPYTVDKFVSAVKMCVDAGDEVIIVDSTYHYWHGKGGMLEYNNSLGGRYQDWAKTNKVYALWLDTILQTPVHFICTSRKKQAYEMTKVDGKTIVEKKGMEDEIRNGFDYEMTVAFDLINDKHLAASAKDRTRLFADKPEFVITSETGKLIKQWCETGADAPAAKPATKTAISDKQYAAIIQRIEASADIDKGMELLNKAKESFTLTDDQAAELVDKVNKLELPV